MSDGPRRRSGSETRKSSARIYGRCTPQQKEQALAVAASHGLSLGGLFLQTILGVKAARQRRPRVDDKILARFLLELGRARDAIKLATAELGKSGSNLNQLAYYVNAGRPPETLSNMLQFAVQEQLEALGGLEEAVRDLAELRLLGLQALGLEGGRASNDNADD